MKRRWLALLAVPMLALAACEDSVPARQDAETPGAWYYLTDPLSNLTFRCHEIISDTSHGHDVRTEWCYGPVEVKDPEVTIGTIP